MMRRYLLFIILVSTINGCAYRPMNGTYFGPAKREPWVASYYPQSTKVDQQVGVVLEQNSEYSVSEITLFSKIGETKLEFYKKNKSSDELVVVFPILGGKYWFERYIARYFVERGIDAVIILRNPEFKKPENIDRIEELLKQSVQRDRLALDYFEKYHGKKQFGSFGISRGAINAVITAGVDERLRSNILVMGGENIVEIFRKTNQGGVGRYLNKVLAAKNCTRPELFKFLKETIKTDPTNLAQYMDARHTMMFISALDKTVPAKFQHRLRKRIGNPRTFYMATDHYLSLMLTQFVPLFLPIRGATILPFDFIETEALNFYREEFNISSFTILNIPYDILVFPSELIFRISDYFSS